MTKTDRLSFLKTRHAALFGVAVTGLIAPSKAEIADTARNVVAMTKTDDDTTDEIRTGFAPTIADESAEIRGETESEILLSRAEKRRLRNEVHALRVAQGKILFLTA